MTEHLNRFRGLLVSLVALHLFAVQHAATADDRTEWIVPDLVHLRSGDTQEWSSFPAEPQSREIEVEFDSVLNADECTLRLRQQDVKQVWQVTINDSVVGELIRDENDQVNSLAVPAGLLVDGTNVLRIESKSQTSDDIRVGDVGLIRLPLEAALDQTRVTIHVIDEASNESVPARITIVNEDGALHPVAGLPSDQLAVRSGVVYPATGDTQFGLPSGHYTIYVGRGFEYSLAQVEIELSTGDSIEHTLRIRREVPTQGYVACDTHVHTLTFSGHGDASIAERMVTLAGEGIELPIATDHNVHINYESYAAEVGVRQHFTPVIGNEFTTPVGHFNIFPIIDGSRVPDYNHTSWGTAFDEIFTTPGVEIVVLNHARDVHSGVRPFGLDHFNDAVGQSLDGWPYRMHAMEVVNSGATQTDALQLFRDWMTLLNAGYRVTPIGASDSHDVARHFVGQARTYIRCDDRDPSQIDVATAVDSLLHGRVMVSYGLLAELTVDDQYTSGDIVSLTADEFQVRVRVLGPHWTRAETVQLYANGELIEERSVDDHPDNEVEEGVLWQGEFILPTPHHDQHLTAISIGPGIEGLYWPTAKAYQPTSIDWEANTIGCSGAVWLDADGEAGFSSARDYAERALAASQGDFAVLLNLLSEYDAATAAQAAALYHAAGGSLTSDEFRAAMTAGPASVQSGFQNYFHAWRASEMARAGE